MRIQHLSEDLRALRAWPAPGTRLERHEAQALAVDAGLRGLGPASPNPAVGCVVMASDGTLLGVGYHACCGGPHAEVMALEATQKTFGQPALEGSTVYVTLEPCNHFGRTPPCCDALLSARIGVVVVAARDPNPHVRGKGLNRLREAGVRVEEDPSWGQDAARLHERFVSVATGGGPFVAIKAALSLDGSIARAGDRRAWISGESARALGRFLRRRYDAVVIGRQTLTLDNPSLVAEERGPLPRWIPWRIALDPDARWALATAATGSPTEQAKMLHLDSKRSVLVVGIDRLEDPKVRHALAASWERFGGQVVALPRVSGMFRPQDLREKLYLMGIQSILLEGGSGLYASFLDAGQVQRLHLFMSPVLLGGQDRILWSRGSGVARRDALRSCELTIVGDDILVEGLIDASNL